MNCNNLSRGLIPVPFKPFPIAGHPDTSLVEHKGRAYHGSDTVLLTVRMLFCFAKVGDLAESVRALADVKRQSTDVQFRLDTFQRSTSAQSAERVSHCST